MLVAQAIYPTIIIVLVALNRSHVENGLTSPAGQTGSCSTDATLRPVTVQIERTVTSQCDYRPRSRLSSLLVIGEHSFGSGESMEAEALAAGSPDEDKAEQIV